MAFGLASPRAGVPIPKFASAFYLVGSELRNRKDTSKPLIVVWLMDLKVLYGDINQI
jgi:hypothetical protein